MDMERLNRWITLGANVGILVGLILVGYEIRQNSDLVRAQIVAVAFSDEHALAIAQMGDAYPSALARSVEEPGSVTLDDVAILQAALEARFVEFRRNAVMEEIGVFTGRWRQDIAYTSRPFTTPIGREFWGARYDNTVDWMREVQAEVDRTEPTRVSGYMESLRRSLISEQDR